MATNFQHPYGSAAAGQVPAAFSGSSGRSQEAADALWRDVRTQPVDVLSLVGNTPLLRLNRIGREHPGVEIYAKAEWFNPGSSVKDRPALNIIREAERSGLMCKQRVLIDSTSGNTGIAYAMICAARGYRLKLFMPSNVSPERKRILHAYGPEVVYTDPLEGSDGAIRAVRDLVRHNAGQYFYANQYDNPANWRAHYHSTALEIFADAAAYWHETETPFWVFAGCEDPQDFELPLIND